MVTLIKPQEVVNTGIFRAAPTTNRFDISLISPHILGAEERFLIPLIGQSLYDDLVAEQNAAVSNYNPDAGALVNKFIAPAPVAYETLWTKYLLRFCSFIAIYEALPFIGLQVASKGLFYNDSEFATNAGYDGIKKMQDELNKRIQDLGDRMKAYLCENKASYPEFEADKLCPCCDDDCGCNCGYTSKFGISCPTCKKGKNSSTNIIFY